MILVVIQSPDVERVSEGLRAGIGLGLRGDPVAVVLTGAAARFAADEAGDGDPRIGRALRTLAELGRPARAVPQAGLAEWVRRAKAVEVWTSPPAQHGSGSRRMALGDREIAIAGRPPRFRRPGGGDQAAIDGAEVVAQIFGSDGPVVLW